MTTIAWAVRAATRRSPWALVRHVVAALRERRAEFARCALLAEMYRARPAVERHVHHVHTSHRAVRVARVRRQRAARAPRGPRHTPGPGRWRMPAWSLYAAYHRGHSWRGRETLFALTHGRAGVCPA
jgi:hypothetical protein